MDEKTLHQNLLSFVHSIWIHYTGNGEDSFEWKSRQSIGATEYFEECFIKLLKFVLRFVDEDYLGSLNLRVLKLCKFYIILEFLQTFAEVID